MSTCFLVIGTHRTGTSAVAGILHTLGINMGDNMLGAHPTNPKGHFEDFDFLYLNDRAVQDWREPAVECFDTEALDEYKRIVALKEQSNSHWGIKDPRLCITAKYIIPYLTDYKVIFTERDLVASAKSLSAAHPELSVDAALVTQGAYLAQREVLSYMFNLQPLVINFEELHQSPEAVVRRLVEFTGFADNLEEAVEFIDPTLKHF